MRDLSPHLRVIVADLVFQVADLQSQVTQLQGQLRNVGNATFTESQLGDTPVVQQPAEAS
jgi:hypothetical protein